MSKPRFKTVDRKIVPSKPPKQTDFPELKDGYPESVIAEKKLDEQHIDSTHPRNAVFAKGKHYQYRGPAYIAKHDGRRLYNNHGHFRQNYQLLLATAPPGRGRRPWYDTADRKEWEERARFPESGNFPGSKSFFYAKVKVLLFQVLPKEGENDRTQSRTLAFGCQQQPYRWTAHHLLPASAFYARKSDGNPVLSSQEMEILWRSFYDINNGHNIMMLPKKNTHVPIHVLVQHPSDHPSYTFHVAQKLQMDLSNALKNAMGLKKHEWKAADILRLLHKSEEYFWRHMVALSKSSVRAALTNDEARSAASAGWNGQIKYQARTTGTLYKYGALG